MPAEESIERSLDAIAPREIPVLARTISALERLGSEQETLQPRQIAQVVLRDPMFTLTVLRHLQTHRSLRKLDDISTIEHAVMMLGLNGFFAAFDRLAAVEQVLAGRPRALGGLLEVIARARAASLYAGSFAALRLDVQGDKLVIAALLHGMAEMLLWCFDPDAAIAIQARLRASPGLRSAEAQRERLGFALPELQRALVRRWGLPEFLQTLMDEAHAETPRAKNVALAVALSRHAANGWGNVAVGCDLAEIGMLLGLKAPEVSTLVFDTSLRALLEGGWYAGQRARCFLPPLPRADDAAGGVPEAERRQALRDLARSWLERIANGRRAQGRPLERAMAETRHDALAAMAAALDGMGAGLGFESAAVLAPGGEGGAPVARLLAGSGTTAGYLESHPDAVRAVTRVAASGTAGAYLETREGGRRVGALLWPVVREGRTAALVAVSEPRGQACLDPECFRIFTELGRDLDAALKRFDVAALLGAGGP